MTKSKIYQELTEAELNAIVTSNFGAVRFEYRLQSGGMFNTTYLVTLEGGDKYILRAGPVNRCLLLPFEKDLMTAESYFNQLCRGHDIPVSEEVICDTGKALIDRDYMIVKYIKSCPLSEMQVDEGAAAQLYREVGGYAAKINAIENDKFGRVSTIAAGYGFEKWSDYLNYEVENNISFLRKLDLYTRSELNEVAKQFQQNRELFDEIKKPKLVHADLWNGNVLITEENGEYHVAAVIDGDRSLFADDEFELASGWMVNDAFLKGYGKALNTDGHSVKRRRLYSMLYDLIDSYVLIAEYDEPEKAVCNRNGVLEKLKELKYCGIK